MNYTYTIDYYEINGVDIEWEEFILGGMFND